MNKTELVDAIASKTELTKSQSKKALEAVLEAVSEALVGGDSVQLVGFGTFKVNHRNGRTGRNPRTGQTIEIKPSSVPAFVAGKALKEKVNVAKK
ncbi:MAG: HU family DNA-binding protein [Succinivibrionaceae bacterium]|jgi:DNA-binding protein HU-alpha|nr:HU family DNA-binding protein [Succinivibrionaceae bacterium]MBQ8976119.1 HU family DNA-binding protein [Succinivibrionaceae bacterium]